MIQVSFKRQIPKAHDMSDMKCEGTCRDEGLCVGEVKNVYVSGNGWITPWVFRYCETAIAVDKSNGFTVEEVDPETNPETETLTAR